MAGGLSTSEQALHLEKSCLLLHSYTHFLSDDAHSELNPYRVNDRATPTMKMSFNMNSMVTKQDLLILLNFYSCGRFLSHLVTQTC